LIVTRGRGYELRLADGEVDVRRFERLLAEGAAREALALWRGRRWATCRSTLRSPKASGHHPDPSTAGTTASSQGARPAAPYERCRAGRHV
jgi:hypothetical protein